MHKDDESSDTPDFEVGPLEELAQVLAASNVLILAQSYHSSVALCLDQLEIAERAKDWATIKEQAHDLKGIAGTFGARRLQELADQLEHLSAEQDSDRIAPMLEDMRRTSQTAQNAIEKLLAAGAPAEVKKAQSGR
jgi:HPt (histidine-containing phosphotransfer) domain-containing protein